MSDITTAPPVDSREVEPVEGEVRVHEHLSAEINNAIDSGEVECLVASRRLESGESQIVHIHNDEATECPLWGVLTPDPREGGVNPYEQKTP